LTQPTHTNAAFYSMSSRRLNNNNHEFDEDTPLLISAWYFLFIIKNFMLIQSRKNKTITLSYVYEGFIIR